MQFFGIPIILLLSSLATAQQILEPITFQTTANNSIIDRLISNETPESEKKIVFNHMKTLIGSFPNVTFFKNMPELVVFDAPYFGDSVSAKAVQDLTKAHRKSENPEEFLKFLRICVEFTQTKNISDHIFWIFFKRESEKERNLEELKESLISGEKKVPDEMLKALGVVNMTKFTAESINTAKQIFASNPVLSDGILMEKLKILKEGGVQKVNILLQMVNILQEFDPAKGENQNLSSKLFDNMRSGFEINADFDQLFLNILDSKFENFDMENFTQIVSEVLFTPNNIFKEQINGSGKMEEFFETFNTDHWFILKEFGGKFIPETRKFKHEQLLLIGEFLKTWKSVLGRRFIMENLLTGKLNEEECNTMLWEQHLEAIVDIAKRLNETLGTRMCFEKNVTVLDIRQVVDVFNRTEMLNDGSLVDLIPEGNFMDFYNRLSDLVTPESIDTVKQMFASNPVLSDGILMEKLEILKEGGVQKVNILLQMVNILQEFDPAKGENQNLSSKIFDNMKSGFEINADFDQLFLNILDSKFENFDMENFTQIVSEVLFTPNNIFKEQIKGTGEMEEFFEKFNMDHWFILKEFGGKFIPETRKFKHEQLLTIGEVLKTWKSVLGRRFIMENLLTGKLNEEECNTMLWEQHLETIVVIATRLNETLGIRLCFEKDVTVLDVKYVVDMFNTTEVLNAESMIEIISDDDDRHDSTITLIWYTYTAFDSIQDFHLSFINKKVDDKNMTWNSMLKLIDVVHQLTYINMTPIFVNILDKFAALSSRHKRIFIGKLEKWPQVSRFFETIKRWGSAEASEFESTLMATYEIEINHDEKYYETMIKFLKIFATLSSESRRLLAKMVQQKWTDGHCTSMVQSPGDYTKFEELLMILKDEFGFKNVCQMDPYAAWP